MKTFVENAIPPYVQEIAGLRDRVKEVNARNLLLEEKLASANATCLELTTCADSIKLAEALAKVSIEKQQLEAQGAEMRIAMRLSAERFGGMSIAMAIDGLLDCLNSTTLGAKLVEEVERLRALVCPKCNNKGHHQDGEYVGEPVPHIACSCAHGKTLEELYEFQARFETAETARVQLMERSVLAMVIAEGDEGWEKTQYTCPMVEAVKVVRQQLTTTQQKLAAAMGVLKICADALEKCDCAVNHAQGACPKSHAIKSIAAVLKDADASGWVHVDGELVKAMEFALEEHRTHYRAWVSLLETIDGQDGYVDHEIDAMLSAEKENEKALFFLTNARLTSTQGKV